jgi:hypothetical protein
MLARNIGVNGSDVVVICAGAAGIQMIVDIVKYLLFEDGGGRQTPKYHSVDVLWDGINRRRDRYFIAIITKYLRYV